MAAVRDPKTGRFPPRPSTSKGASREQIQQKLDAAAEALAADDSAPGTREAQVTQSKVARLTLAREAMSPSGASYMAPLLARVASIDGTTEAELHAREVAAAGGGEQLTQEQELERALAVVGLLAPERLK